LETNPLAAIPRHYPSLDGLRGIAILLVIPHNANIMIPVLHGPFKAFTLFIDRGWFGANLFFVLSGFLITEQLYLTRHASNYFAGFYARRVLRIVPLFFVAVALAAVLTRALPNRGHGATTPIWVLSLGLFFINWTEPLGLALPGFPQFWSLAVEEQFYVVWPAVVRAFASRLLAVSFGITVVALGVRILMLLSGANPTTVYMWTVCRMDALAFGAVAAIIAQRWRTRDVVPRPWPWLRNALAIAVLGALLTRLYASDTWPTQTVGYTCLGLSGMLLLLWALANDMGSRQERLATILRSHFLGSVGRYSYGMYVFHMLFVVFAAEWIKRLATPFGEARMLACALLIIALSYAAGYLSYHLFEKYFLRLGRRYFSAVRS
jgi:peptidoglycan/LPS O-acetylase OafA/YrhL